jgi:hypothetical protein
MTALPPKTEVDLQSCYVADVPTTVIGKAARAAPTARRISAATDPVEDSRTIE